MENKNSKIATTAFLLIILSTTEMPPVLKYVMLFITTICFIITVTQLYEAYKANKTSSSSSNPNKS